MSRLHHGSIKATGVTFPLAMIFVFYLIFMVLNPANAQIQSSQFSVPASENAEKEVLENHLRSARYGFISRHQYSSKQISSIKESLSASLCVLDVNKDGFQDILSVGGGGFQREFGRKAWWSESSKLILFLNYKGQYFLPNPIDNPVVQELAMLNCASADLNGDGFEDLIITHLEGHQILYNQAQDADKELSFLSGPSLQKQSEFPIHALPIDINDDGLLDIYSSHFIRYAKGQKTAQSDQGFQVQSDVNFRAALFDSQANSVYLQAANQDSFIASSVPAIQSGIGRSIASYSADIDRNGQSDIAVINSFDSRSRFFLKDEDEFVEASDAFRLLSSDNTLAMTLSEPSFNQDSGAVQLYLARAAGSSSQLLEYNTVTQSWEIVSNTLTDRRLALQNSEWSVASRDVDFNGYVDYYIGAGLEKPMSDSPHFVTGQANRLLLQYAKHQFEEHDTEHSAFLPLSTRGVAFIDIDNNGTVELLSANNNGWFRLQTLNIEPPEYWIGFQLPRSAKWQAAKIEVFDEQHQFQQTAVFANHGFAQSDNRLVFKLPKQSNWQAKILKQSGEVVLVTLSELNHYIGIDESGTSFKIANSHDAEIENSVLTNTPLQSGQQLERLSPRQQTILIKRFVEQPERLVPFLSEHWKRIHDESRRALLYDLAKLPVNIQYFLIEQMLQFDSGNFVAPILTYLETVEPEYAQFWMEGFLSNLQGDEFCSGMTVLKTLFHEEEAMVLSKQLLISSLILKSESSSTTETLCLLPVLGEAENQRVSLQLIKQLDATQDERIKSAVIKSLGNLRDSRAEGKLRAIVLNEDNMQLVAESMIALKRMQQLKLTEKASSYFSRLADYQVWQLLASLVNNPDFGVLLNSDRQVLVQLLKSRESKPREPKENIPYLFAHLLDDKPNGKLIPFLDSSHVDTRVLAALIMNKRKQTRHQPALDIMISELNPTHLPALMLVYAETNLNVSESLSLQLMQRWYEKYELTSLLALFSYVEGRHITTFILSHPSLLSRFADIADNTDSIDRAEMTDNTALVYKLNWTMLLENYQDLPPAQQLTLLSLWYRHCAINDSRTQTKSCVNKNVEIVTANKVKLYLNQYFSADVALQPAALSVLISAAQSDWQLTIGIVERKLGSLSSAQLLPILANMPAKQIANSPVFAEKIASIDKRMLALLASKESAKFEETWYRFERIINTVQTDLIDP